MALIKGQEVSEGPSGVPANPKLWNMITAQAGTKFSKNSPARGHWIHARYTQMGGKFVDSKKEIDPRARDYVQEEIDKKKEKVKEQISRKVTKKVTKPINKIP
jgi:hypothetical protein